MGECMKIYCCGCCSDVEPVLVSGKEIYPHRQDLYGLPFWRCEECGNYVGCHHKTRNRTAPLGCIPTKEIKEARKKVHALLDPLWQNGGYKRAQLYKIISDKLGWKYHTANIKTTDEAAKVVQIISSLTTTTKG